MILPDLGAGAPIHTRARDFFCTSTWRRYYSISAPVLLTAFGSRTILEKMVESKLLLTVTPIIT